MLEPGCVVAEPGRGDTDHGSVGDSTASLARTGRGGGSPWPGLPESGRGNTDHRFGGDSMDSVIGRRPWLLAVF